MASALAPYSAAAVEEKKDKPNIVLNRRGRHGLVGCGVLRRGDKHAES